MIGKTIGHYQILEKIGQGTYSRHSVTKSGFEAAEQYFNLALQKGPTCAAAWAGIARVWNGRGQMGWAPSREASRGAKAAALKALEVDDGEWEAHRALAGILTWGDWNWPAAEQEWKRIIEHNTNHVEALQGYSHFLMNVGRPDEAMAQIERALELDPFSVRSQSFYATDLVYVRRYDDAIAAARAALRLQPDTPVARNPLYQALFLKGMYGEALPLDREQFAGDRELTEALEQGFAESGYIGAQRRLVEVWIARFSKPGGIACLGSGIPLYLRGRKGPCYPLARASVRGSRRQHAVPGHADLRLPALGSAIPGSSAPHESPAVSRRPGFLSGRISAREVSTGVRSVLTLIFLRAARRPKGPLTPAGMIELSHPSLTL